MTAGVFEMVLLWVACAGLGVPGEVPGTTPWVPPEWQEKARALVDPGAGLPGGLALKKVEVGPRVTASYEGEAGRLVVGVVAEGEDVAWQGERLALVVDETTLKGEARKAAVEALIELLKRREASWGWLRRAPPPPDPGPALEALRRVQRDAILGRREAVERAVAQIAGEHLDLAVRLAAARLLHLAGAPESARELGVKARQRAERGVGEAQLEGRPRLILALARAAAMAGDPEAAVRFGQTLLGRAELRCGLEDVARDLVLAGHEEAALQLLRRLTAKARECERAMALAADRDRIAGRLDEAALRIGAGLEARPASPWLRAARARLALTRGDAKAAFDDARVALRAAPQQAELAELLYTVMARGGVDAQRRDDWLRGMTRNPSSPPSQLFGGVACLAQGEDACAADALGKAGPYYAALESLAATRAGRLDRAEARLEEAWLGDAASPVTLLAAAELAAKRDDAALEEAARRAYERAVETTPGPLPPVARAAPAAPAERPGQPAEPAAGAPAVEEGTGELTTLLILGGGTLALFLVWLRVRRAGREPEDGP